MDDSLPSMREASQLLLHQPLESVVRRYPKLFVGPLRWGRVHAAVLRVAWDDAPAWPDHGCFARPKLPNIQVRDLQYHVSNLSCLPGQEDVDSDSDEDVHPQLNYRHRHPLDRRGRRPPRDPKQALADLRLWAMDSLLAGHHDPNLCLKICAASSSSSQSSSGQPGPGRGRGRLDHYLLPFYYGPRNRNGGPAGRRLLPACRVYSFMAGCGREFLLVYLDAAHHPGPDVVDATFRRPFIAGLLVAAAQVQYDQLLREYGEGEGSRERDDEVKGDGEGMGVEGARGEDEDESKPDDADAKSKQDEANSQGKPDDADHQGKQDDVAPPIPSESVRLLFTDAKNDAAHVHVYTARVPHFLLAHLRRPARPLRLPAPYAADPTRPFVAIHQTRVAYAPVRDFRPRLKDAFCGPRSRRPESGGVQPLDLPVDLPVEVPVEAEAST